MPACRAEEDLRRDAKGRHDHEGVVSSLEDPRRRVVCQRNLDTSQTASGTLSLFEESHDLPGWTAHLRGPGIVKVEPGGPDNPTNGGRGDVR